MWLFSAWPSWLFQEKNEFFLVTYPIYHLEIKRVEPPFNLTFVFLKQYRSCGSYIQHSSPQEIQFNVQDSIKECNFIGNLPKLIPFIESVKVQNGFLKLMETIFPTSVYFSGLKVTIIIFKVVHSVPYILKSIIIQLEFNPISLSVIYFGSSKVPIISTFLKKYLLYIKQDHAAILCAYLSVDLSLHCEFL